MNDSNQTRFLIPVLSAVPFLFVACSDGDDPINTDIDAGSTDDTTGADGTSQPDSTTEPDALDDITEPDSTTEPDAVEDTTEPDAVEDTTEPDAVEDVVETDGSSEGDVVETDGSSEGDATTDVVEDTTTDADATTDAAEDTATDATTDTADGTIEPDTDTGVELTAYEEFLAGIDATVLATYCGEIVDCGYEDTVADCEAFAPTFLDDVIEYAYEVTPDGLREGCVDAAIAFTNCRLESGYCYYGYYGSYFIGGGFYDCGDEYDAVDALCLTPFAATCDDDTIRLEFAQLCDGASDCVDGFDESACSLCEDGTTLFRDELACDGNQNCAVLTGDSTDLGDELGCDPATIFECADGTGVRQSDVCDGFNDCADGSDEVDCPVFTCADGTTEILEGLVCDGTADCANESADSSDFSDETDCPIPTIFVCADGLEATRYTFVCDGGPDCTDGSDEVGCALDFVCDDESDTIPPNWVCDRESDCDDSSDEVDCPPDFECADGSDTIPPGWICDFDIDCADGSDEVGCLD